MLDAIKPEDFVVLFDERGKNLNSPQFAQSLERILNSGKKRCVWIIGGAYGVGDEIKDRADLKLANRAVRAKSPRSKNRRAGTDLSRVYDFKKSALP